MMEETASPYSYPVLYIEDEGEDCWICGSIFTFSTRTGKGLCRSYKKTIYEEALDEIIDLKEGKTTVSFCVVLPGKEKALMVESGRRVSLLEVKGRKVVIVAREGQRVDPRSVIAHTITSSGSSRTIRAGMDGIVVFIGVISHINPEHYIVAIAGEDDVRILVRGD